MCDTQQTSVRSQTAGRVRLWQQMFDLQQLGEVTFVLLLDLLVPCSLPEVGQDLSQLGDHDVVGGQSRLSLKDTDKLLINDSDRLQDLMAPESFYRRRPAPKPAPEAAGSSGAGDLDADVFRCTCAV